MRLEIKSQQLKDIIATYNSDWLLGDLSFLIHAGKDKANDQLGQLSSPMRQLYYLAGLNVCSDPDAGIDVTHDREKWQLIVQLLNEIEHEHDKLFFPNSAEDITAEWRRIRKVAMPSFLAYFNQGPLNYEEQVINWVTDLYTPLDKIIEHATCVKTKDFVQFYDNLDKLKAKNFQAYSARKDLLRPNWDTYTKLKMGVVDDAPDFIKEMGERDRHLYTYMSDHGIIDRFYPEEIASASLPVEKVNIILQNLVIKREENDFLYYTGTRPGNPLYEKPILYIGDGMYQIFEVKQVIHGIYRLLEKICSAPGADFGKYVHKKGDLLEDRVAELLCGFFKSDYEIHRGYYVDGCEQDILVLWRKQAFIIETKAYTHREPLRNPDIAFVRIQDDFRKDVGYGYTQTRRVEQKFIDRVPLRITNKSGKLIQEIDTTLYEHDFSIIVNLQSFGQIQCDLSTLIELGNHDDVYPWAIKLDDLEIFILTMIAQKKTPKDFVHFLLMRETLHGKLICSDELEICGGFLTGKLKMQHVARARVVVTKPDFGDVFDKQYYKTMGFKNERNIYEKQSGKFAFW